MAYDEKAIFAELKRVRELNRELKERLESLAPIANVVAKSTLSKILCGPLPCDALWAIYVEDESGCFSPDSPARLGLQIFENGGVLDNCELFMSCLQVSLRRETWIGLFSVETSVVEEWEAAYEFANNDVDWADSVRSNLMKRTAVIEWVEENHVDWYEAARQEWENRDRTEFAQLLIDEANEPQLVA